MTVEDGRPGLLLDPTVDQAIAAIEAAIADAAGAKETLILAYIGHGEFTEGQGGDFYLMPTDATRPTSRRAIHFAEVIKDCIKDIPGFELVALLDTCHAGAGVWQSMERWARSLRGDLSFDLLTATDDRATANAPLTRAIIEHIERGDPEFGRRIHCRDIHHRLQSAGRATQHVAYNANDRLFLARNPALDPGDVFWRRSFGFDQLLQRTQYFQPTRELTRLVEASVAHRVVVLTGVTGAGKSSLAAALARPELTGGLVPEGFVQAISLLDSTFNERRVAEDIERQLRDGLPTFKEAFSAFGRTLPSLPIPPGPLRRMVTGPLENMEGKPQVRIVIDGLNQVPDATRTAVVEALGTLPESARLIISTQPETPGCPSGHPLTVGHAESDELNNYLSIRRVPEGVRTALIDRADGHWLIARLLADAVLIDPGIDLARLPSTVEDAFTLRLDQAIPEGAWSSRFRPVLGLLAVAGAGPILPLALLVHASRSLGGPQDEEAVREILTALRGLVLRREPGMPGEQVGLFHPTLVGYLRSPSSGYYAIDEESSHSAMLRAIDDLAPTAIHQRDDPLYRYAFIREPKHVWAGRDHEATLYRLIRRGSNDPRENLEKWSQWLFIFMTELGVAHPATLTARHNLASWTGEAGDARRALAMYDALLADRVRVLGRDHPDTLTTFHNLADIVGAVGDARRALALYEALLPVRERVLGRDHPATLTTRSNMAAWRGEAGDAPGALALYEALLPDRERVLGRDHPDSLTTRHNLASWTAAAGDARGALALYEALLPDRERVLGRDHPATLLTRLNLAGIAGEAGDARGALVLYAALLPDMERVLGRDHPNTLMTRHNLACLVGEAGDARGALALYAALLPDRERVLGRDHPDVLITIDMLAVLTVRIGNTRGGCQLFREGLMRAEERFGAEDSLTRTFRDQLRRYGCQER